MTGAQQSASPPARAGLTHGRLRTAGAPELPLSAGGPARAGLAHERLRTAARTRRR